MGEEHVRRERLPAEEEETRYVGKTQGVSAPSEYVRPVVDTIRLDNIVCGSAGSKNDNSYPAVTQP